MLLGALASLISASVSAQRAVLRRPALHWVRGPGTETCVEPRTLAAAVEDLVGPVLVRAPEAENSIEGQVEVLPNGSLRVRLRVSSSSGATGERVLEHTGACSALTPAIAFVVAMMIDPGVAAHGLPASLVALLGAAMPEEELLAELEGPVAHTAEPHPAQPSAPPPSDLPAPQAEREPEPIAERPEVPPAREDDAELDSVPGREQLGVQAALLVRLSVREVARPMWSGEERMLFELRSPLSLAAHVRGGAQAGDYEFEPGRTIRIAVIAAGIALCAGHTGRALLRLNGCLGGELSVALARGAGLTEQRASFRGDGAVVAQLTARLRLYRQWGITLLVNGRLSLVRRRFMYEDQARRFREAYTMERPSISFAAGPTYEF